MPYSGNLMANVGQPETDADDELAAARSRVQRVRDWRWKEQTEEDILGFKRKTPPPPDSLDLSRNMVEVLVKGQFEDKGDYSMGIHERAAGTAEDQVISGRRLLQALCKLVLLADVFMQLVLASWLLAGQPLLRTEHALQHPPYVLSPPSSDIDWRADPPRYKGYVRAVEAATYAERGFDTLELAIGECNVTSALQQWGVDDGHGAWQAGTDNTSAPTPAPEQGGVPDFAKLFPLASYNATTGAAACLGCGRSPLSCSMASLLTSVTPELRQCMLRWPIPPTIPEGVLWQVSLPAEGNDLAIRFGEDTSRCLSASDISSKASVTSAACSRDGVYQVADVIRPPRDGSAPRLSGAPSCTRLACPGAWSFAEPKLHQQWRWQRLQADVAAAPTNLLRNGGFEVPDVGHGTKNVRLGESVGGWQHFGGGYMGTIFGTSYGTPWGKQSMHLHGLCMRTQGGIRQRFDAAPGVNYTLGFAASGGAWSFGSGCATCANFALDKGTLAVVDGNSAAAALAWADPARTLDVQNATLAMANFSAGGDILEVKFGSNSNGVVVSRGGAAWRRWELHFTAPASGKVLLSFWAGAGHCIQIDDVSVVAASASASPPRNAMDTLRAPRRGLLRQYFAERANGDGPSTPPSADGGGGWPASAAPCECR